MTYENTELGIRVGTQLCTPKVGMVEYALMDG